MSWNERIRWAAFLVFLGIVLGALGRALGLDQAGVITLVAIFTLGALGLLALGRRLP